MKKGRTPFIVAALFVVAATFSARLAASAESRVADEPTQGAESSADARNLSNPQSSARTRALYRFLCEVYGKNALAGQQESTWMGSEDFEFEIIEKASGKLPALRGLDYMNDDFRGVNRRAKKWFAKGGIVTICWHCGSDFRGSHRESLNSDLDWDKALTPGTAEYKALINGMDKGAKALATLKEADIPVIWRPFHEFDGKWFWWGKGGPENFKKLWRLMYDRYTNYWNLNNLIWNLGYCGEVNDGWYPGDDCVDIVGADTYVDHDGSLVDLYAKAARVADKPVCLHENGPIPDPEKMKADGAKWLWFMTWHTSFVARNKINDAEHIKSAYNNDYTITLDELPDLYGRGDSDAKKDAAEPNSGAFQYDPAKEYVEYPRSYAEPIEKGGVIVKEEYEGINGKNALNVYLPYGYDENKKYNIFYFMHGMGDDEGKLLYTDGGEMKRVFDNMIQNGDIEPMIVVTPTFAKSGADKFYAELRESVIPFVEGKYSTYAESTSPEDIAASRMHRAYGGFSMGSLSTWAVFRNCLDIVGYYMPLSLDYWSGGDTPFERASALARAVDESGLAKDKYFIFTATGTDDMAYRGQSAQVAEMRKMEQFVETSDFSKGNFWFFVSDGGKHSWFYVRQYLYNILPYFFHED